MHCKSEFYLTYDVDTDSRNPHSLDLLRTYTPVIHEQFFFRKPTFSVLNVWIEYYHVKYWVAYSSTTAICSNAVHVFTIIAAHLTSTPYALFPFWNVRLIIFFVSVSCAFVWFLNICFYD